jgi:hypothetical protein
LDKNPLLWQTFPFVSLKIVCPEFTLNLINTQQGDYPKLQEAKKLDLRDLYLAKACNIKLSPELDRLLKIAEWGFASSETDCDDVLIQRWQAE